MEESASPRAKVTWLDSEIAAKVIRINATIAYCTSRAIGKLLRHSTKIILDRSDIEPGVVYVVAANHQCRIDPFLISGMMPYSNFLRYDFRYFLLNSILDIPVLGSVLRGLGCFPAKHHPKYPFGLNYATEQLSKGRSIFIFPEGRRTLQGEYPAHHGIEVLAHLPKVMLIPAHIEWRGRGWWNGYKLGIGKPFNGKDMTAQQILDRVYKLPVE